MIDTDATAGPVPAPLVPEEASPPRTPTSGAPDAPRGFAQCSDRIDAISAALAKAQGQIANPAKGAVNPHFKSQYADLSAGLNAIRPALSANAIAIVQATRMDGEVLMLGTRLAHASGQWIGSEWPVVKLPAAPQVIGSALTYARRYTLFALVGIAGEDEDDDGNAASGNADDSGPIDADMIAFVEQQLRDTETDINKFLAYVRAPSVAQMTLSQYKLGVARLNDKKRRAAAQP